LFNEQVTLCFGTGEGEGEGEGEIGCLDATALMIEADPTAPPVVMEFAVRVPDRDVDCEEGLAAIEVSLLTDHDPAIAVSGVAGFASGDITGLTTVMSNGENVLALACSPLPAPAEIAVQLFIGDLPTEPVCGRVAVPPPDPEPAP
jgi:hypothetical protein